VLQGEGITDDSVFVVKTHYPERPGYIRFRAQKAVLLVRNPFDAIYSYFHMALTNTHTDTLTDDAFASLGELWRSFVKNEALVWNNFNSYWLRSGLGLHVVRFEDLTSDISPVR
jgi:hypothetical protein